MHGLHDTTPAAPVQHVAGLKLVGAAHFQQLAVSERHDRRAHAERTAAAGLTRSAASHITNESLSEPRS